MTRRSAKAAHAPQDEDTEMVATVRKNIDGAFNLLLAIARDPELVDQIPDGATVVLEYDDDPETTSKNRAAALNAQRQGKPVHVHRVRAEEPVSSPGAPVNGGATQLRNGSGTTDGREETAARTPRGTRKGQRS